MYSYVFASVIRARIFTFAFLFSRGKFLLSFSEKRQDIFSLANIMNVKKETNKQSIARFVERLLFYHNYLRMYREER